ncbi:tripartite tricarboxylate transporter TctB family protein [Pseudomonas sp. D(2018)]|uniref:tripartite tricarboxylate transporter TctB family protein n=1 Tax=Pseudomonas sp. D(2018) TaxID=2502238 RepID=UPI0010F81EE4|nr:tripartite tricarboxylate transporter TctB family protein [Pseudomonas sp. D(2018)]
MSRNLDSSALVGTRWVEAGLALFTALVGAVVMYGSHAGGIGWGDAGPEPGYFPFYIGLLLSAASLANLVLAIARWRSLAEAFVSRGAFRQVLAVFLPIVLYVACMPFTGIYLASAGFIAWFMWRDRQREKPYGFLTIAAVSCGAALASYLVFALWFKVPLQAGPLAMLGGLLK